MVATTAERCASAAAVSTTDRYCECAGSANRFEFATRTYRSWSTSTSPTGAGPTATVARSAFGDFAISFAASKARSALLPRAVIQSTPEADKAARTGEQPAGALKMTAWLGSDRARSTSMTSSVPGTSCPPSVVTNTYLPSRDIAKPTGTASVEIRATGVVEVTGADEDGRR